MKIILNYILNFHIYTHIILPLERYFISYSVGEEKKKKKKRKRKEKFLAVNEIKLKFGSKIPKVPAWKKSSRESTY